jgi:Zn-finger nucleic acid-binding protein
LVAEVGISMPNEVAFDECPSCRGSVAPRRTTKWTVQLICGSCGYLRQAADRETDQWLGQLGFGCPTCGSRMRVHRSHGLELRCTAAGCHGHRDIAAVSAAACGEPLPEVE